MEGVHDSAAQLLSRALSLKGGTAMLVLGFLLLYLSFTDPFLGGCTEIACPDTPGDSSGILGVDSISITLSQVRYSQACNTCRLSTKLPAGVLLVLLGGGVTGFRLGRRLVRG